MDYGQSNKNCRPSKAEWLLYAPPALSIQLPTLGTVRLGMSNNSQNEQQLFP
jgi:hypothetical protein